MWMCKIVKLYDSAFTTNRYPIETELFVDEQLLRFGNNEINNIQPPTNILYNPATMPTVPVTSRAPSGILSVTGTVHILNNYMNDESHLSYVDQFSLTQTV